MAGGFLDPATIVGGLVALGVAFFGGRASSRKNEIDESALILGKYKELADTFQNQVKLLQSQFDEFKVAAATEKATLMQEIDGLRSRIRHLEDENAGYRRALAQNSQSTAFLLERRDKKMDDDIDKLNRLGDNLRGGK